MAWTYNGSPGTSTAAGRRDAVRLYVGDTDYDDQQLTDGEVDFALSETSNDIYSASAMVCRALAGRYSREVDSSIDSVRESASQKMEHYTQLAQRYDQQSATFGGGLGTPYVGGISESAMDSVEDDTDRVRPAFKRGRFDNPPESAYDDWDGDGD